MIKRVSIPYVGQCMEASCYCRRTREEIRVPLFQDNGRGKIYAASCNQMQHNNSGRAYTYIIYVRDSNLIGICSHNKPLYKFRASM